MRRYSSRDFVVAALLWMAPTAALSDPSTMPSYRFVPGRSIADAPQGQWENPQRFSIRGTMMFGEPGQTQEQCTGEGMCSYLRAGDEVSLTNEIKNVNGEGWVKVKVRNGSFKDGSLGDSEYWAKLNDLTAEHGRVDQSARDNLQNGKADGSRQAFIQAAKQLEGTPYVWGGESKGGVDCSGLVVLSKKMAGIPADLPRQSKEQAAFTGANLPQDQAKMGDLAFFGEPVHHVAICADDGCKTIIEAPNTGSVVQEHPLTGQAKFGDFIDKGGAQSKAG